MRKARSLKMMVVMALIAMMLPIVLIGFVMAADPAPAPVPAMEWFSIIAALINTAGVLGLVQALKIYMPWLREKLPWILPILAGAIGPAVAALQGWLGGVLGVAIDISPVIAIFTGGSAVAANQVWKQAGK